VRRRKQIPVFWFRSVWRPRQWSPGAIQPVGKYRCHQHGLWAIAEQETQGADLLERIAELEKDLERACGANTDRADPAISSVVSASQPPFATGLFVPNSTSVASVRPPSWSGSQTVPYTVTENCTTRSSYASQGFQRMVRSHIVKWLAEH